MPGLLKIGCTDRNIKERVQELNSATGVPAPFDIEAVFFSADCLSEEKQIHSALGAYRVEGKEFFRLTLVESLRTIEKALNRRPHFVHNKNNESQIFDDHLEDFSMQEKKGNKLF
jgi:hypothetical protein